MNQRLKLSTTMTLRQFDNGYWYATQLKDFAEVIGIPSARNLRKDELEKAIRLFLETGKVKSVEAYTGKHAGRRRDRTLQSWIQPRHRV